MPKEMKYCMNVSPIYIDELTMLRNILRNLILDMINENEKYDILYSYFKKYDNNKI